MTDNWPTWCPNCHELQKLIQQKSEETNRTFALLKQKIISSGSIFSKYEEKEKECAIYSQKVQSLASLTRQMNDDLKRREIELSNALQELTPLKQKQDEMLALVKRKNEEIERLNEQRETSDDVHQQLQKSLKSMGDEFEKQKTTIKKLEKQINKMKTNMNGQIKRSDVDSDKKQISAQISSLLQLALYFAQILEKNQLLPTKTSVKVKKLFNNPKSTLDIVENKVKGSASELREIFNIIGVDVEKDVKEDVNDDDDDAYGDMLSKLITEDCEDSSSPLKNMQNEAVEVISSSESSPENSPIKNVELSPVKNLPTSPVKTKSPCRKKLFDNFVKPQDPSPQRFPKSIRKSPRRKKVIDVHVESKSKSPDKLCQKSPTKSPRKKLFESFVPSQKLSPKIDKIDKIDKSKSSEELICKSSRRRKALENFAQTQVQEFENCTNLQRKPIRKNLFDNKPEKTNLEKAETIDVKVRKILKRMLYRKRALSPIPPTPPSKMSTNIEIIERLNPVDESASKTKQMTSQEFKKKKVTRPRILLADSFAPVRSSTRTPPVTRLRLNLKDKVENSEERKEVADDNKKEEIASKLTECVNNLELDKSKESGSLILSSESKKSVEEFENNVEVFNVEVLKEFGLDKNEVDDVKCQNCLSVDSSLGVDVVENDLELSDSSVCDSPCVEVCDSRPKKRRISVCSSSSEIDSYSVDSGYIEKKSCDNLKEKSENCGGISENGFGSERKVDTLSPVKKCPRLDNGVENCQENEKVKKKEDGEEESLVSNEINCKEEVIGLKRNIIKSTIVEEMKNEKIVNGNDWKFSDFSSACVLEELISKVCQIETKSVDTEGNLHQNNKLIPKKNLFNANHARNSKIVKIRPVNNLMVKNNWKNSLRDKNDNKIECKDKNNDEVQNGHVSGKEIKKCSEIISKLSGETRKNGFLKKNVLTEEEEEDPIKLLDPRPQRKRISLCKDLITNGHNHENLGNELNGIKNERTVEKINGEELRGNGVGGNENKLKSELVGKDERNCGEICSIKTKVNGLMCNGIVDQKKDERIIRESVNCNVNSSNVKGSSRKLEQSSVKLEENSSIISSTSLHVDLLPKNVPSEEKSSISSINHRENLVPKNIPFNLPKNLTSYIEQIVDELSKSDEEVNELILKTNNDEAVLSTKEKTLLNQLNIRTKTMCLKDKKKIHDILLANLTKAIFSNADLKLSGQASLCRFFCVICRTTGDLERARVLVYDILCILTSVSGYLILNVFGVWRCVLTSNTCNGDLCKTIQFLLLNGRSSVGLSVSCVDFLRKMFSFEKEIDHDHYVVVLIEKLHTLSEEGDVQIIHQVSRSIELLASVSNWSWTSNFLIEKHLWSEIIKWETWNKEKLISEECSRDRFTANVLIVLGNVCLKCPLEKSSFVCELMKKLLVLLQSTEQHTGRRVVHEAIVEVILKLHPFNSETAKQILMHWLPSVTFNISPHLKSLMDYVAKKIMLFVKES